MILNLIFDDAANGPGATLAAFRATMTAAANMLAAHITDDITLNIKVDYDNFAGAALPNANTSEGNISSYNPVDYSTLLAALTSHATSADDATAIANLPTGANVEGHSSFFLGTAEEKALGLGGVDPHGTGIDGEVGMGSGFGTGDTLFAGAIHELTHAMGRIAGTSLDLFRFNEDNSGNRVFGFNIPALAAYFALGTPAQGAAKLADFGISSDPGDWLNGGIQGSDPDNESVGGRGITKVGMQVMDVLGFHVANAGPTVTALTGAAGEDGPVFGASLLSGAADPEGDALSIAGLTASVSTSGGRVLTQGIDYSLSSAGKLSLTSAAFAKFNSLADGVNDTATFGFDVQDFLGAKTHNTLALTIAGANDGPVAQDIVGSVSEDGPATVLTAIYADPDIGDTHSFSFNAAGTVGLVANNNDGTFSYNPNGKFEALALGQTATDTFTYEVDDNHGGVSIKTATVTIIGANDAPIIQTGGGGDAATYDVRVNNAAITTVHATDVDNGSSLTYSLLAGQDSTAFTINALTGALSFASLPKQPHNAYHVQVQVSDGALTDVQSLTVNVASAKMAGTAAVDTFVFHPTGTNQVSGFDAAQDYLQFDKGMFSADTGAAVLAAISADNHGGLVISDALHDKFTIDGATIASLAAHVDHILFV